MKKILFLISFLFPCALLAETAMPWSIMPAIGYYHYANKRGISDDWIPLLSIGKKLNENLAAEVLWGNIGTEYEGPQSRDVSGFLLTMSGLYFLPMNANAFHPYLTAGVGVINLRPRENNDPNVEMHVDGGVGIQYIMSDRVALRAEGRDLYTPNGGKNDLLAYVGLQFFFYHMPFVS